MRRFQGAIGWERRYFAKLARHATKRVTKKFQR